MSYYAHDQGTFDKLKNQIEELTEIQMQLPSWPMQFVGDMKNKLAKHGREIALSEKQVEKLDDVYKQYVTVMDEEKVRDTYDKFRELENRDKGRRFR